MSKTHNDTRCKARTKAGKPCRAAATEGGRCFFHANPAKASELGRIGGRKNRHVMPYSADELTNLHDAVAIRDAVNRVLQDLYSGKVGPRIASAAAPLLNLQMRTIEVTDMAQRLARLEKRELERTSGGAGGEMPENPTAERPMNLQESTDETAAPGTNTKKEVNEESK
jgi:hypothetical protein